VKLAAAFAGITRVLLDTSPVVYLLEHHPDYGPLMTEFERFRNAAGIDLVTSPVTLAECLVHPLRDGNLQAANAYHRLIVEAEGTEFWRIGSAEAALAAQLRTQFQLHLADALQIAVAMRSGCQALLTNDAALNRITQLTIVQVSNLVV
jgi:predicted nucleic acid-binding protein